MAVEVLPNQQARVEDKRYQAGEIIHNIAEDVKAELIKLGVVKDLEAPAAPAAPTQQPQAAAQVQEDLQRDAVGDQMKAAVNQDVIDAQRTIDTPGEKVGPLPTPPGEQVPAEQPAPAAPAAPTE